MPKFNVAMTEVVEYLIPVEAADEAEAEEKARLTYTNSTREAADDWFVCVRARECEGVNPC